MRVLLAGLGGCSLSKGGGEDTKSDKDIVLRWTDINGEEIELVCGDCPTDDELSDDDLESAVTSVADSDQSVATPALGTHVII